MPILRFENVTKQFDSDSYGVYEINFSVEPGEFIFVTGPSGSGKTTLMRLLLKEYPFSSGEIFFHEDPLSTLSSSKVHLHRRKIGVVFQDYKLIPEMNIWENIALPLWVTGKGQDEVERRVTDLLNLIKLPEKALHFPSQLSGGEAQRVGIARALAIGPEIVIADEPTGNLDPETAQHVARLLKKINELGTTVIIATHDKNIIATYPETRKIALEKGKLVDDTHAAATPKHKSQKHTHKETTHAQSSQPTTSPTEINHADQAPASEPTTPAERPSLPWWKKILGGGKKTTETTPTNNASDHSNQPSKDTIPDPTDTTDLVTISQEALNDDEDIAAKHDKHSKPVVEKPGDKKK